MTQILGLAIAAIVIIVLASALGTGLEHLSARLRRRNQQRAGHGHR